MKKENWVTQDYESDLAVAYQKKHCMSDKESFDLDMHLHLAHVEMLYKQEIITKEEAGKILGALDALWKSGPDVIEIRPGRADLFSNLEDWLVDAIGVDIGGKFHIGRSRNDMNCTLSKMMCRSYSIDFGLAACKLIGDLLDKAAEHIETVMPGYTHHSQHAQPTTMGHYLLWGADSFLRDLDRASAWYGRNNRSSMGAAALCTTGFSLDRHYIADLLGFDGVTEHSIDAAGSRDFMLDMGSYLSVFQSNLGRLTELLLVWNIREIGIVRLAKKHCSYSSIMPQKVNPVGVEMVRHTASTTYGTLMSMLDALKSTTPGNGREPSYLDGYIMAMVSGTIPAAEYAGEMVKEMAVNAEQCLKLAREGFSTMTELADDMVRLKGMSFYMAHKIVAKLAAIAVEKNIPCEEISSELIDAVSMELFERKAGFTAAELKRALDPLENVKSRSILGGPSFEETRRMLAARRETLAKERTFWETKKRYQQSKIAEVKSLARQIIGA